MKKIFIIFLLTFLLFACVRKKDHDLFFEDITDAKCYPVPYTELLGITMQMQKYDSLLFLNDFHGDSLIHVFDLKNQYSLCKLIPRGNGPDELISPLEFHIMDGLIYIYSHQQFSLFSVSLESCIEEKRALHKISQVPSKVSRIFPLNDTLFIASGVFEKKYALINVQGEIISEFGEYPDFWDEERNIPSIAKGMFHQSQFEKGSRNNCFISFSSHVLDIFTFSGSTPVLAKRIPFGKYSYSFTTGEMLSAKKSDNTEEGIISASCSSDKIYLVYNSMNKSQIKVLSWEGNPIKQININKRVTCLCIDEKEKKGYIIVSDPNDSLMYFDL